MAEEAKVTQDAETIAPVVPKEGTVAAEVAKVAPETTKSADTVPLSVYLSLKDDVKELKKDLKEAKEAKKPSVVLEGVKELKDKYPDVDENFINDMLGAATTKATYEIEKKYTPIIAKQDEKEKKAAFDAAFDKVYSKALADNPDLPADRIDKDVVKTLALTPDYQNVPIADIVVKLYGGSTSGKATTENDMRTSSDREVDVVNFEKMTKEQRDAVLDDPKTRKKYFDYLDKTNN